MKVATACILREKDSTLLLYRHGGKEDMHNGYYVFPGGRLDPGELPFGNIHREFKEETGLSLIGTTLRALWVCDNRKRFLGGKMDREDFFVNIYQASSYTGSLKAEEGKNADPLWIPDSRLEEVNMYPGDRKLLALLNKNPEGVFEAIQQYCGETLVAFGSKRVA